MSDETHAALSAAIQAHVADEYDGNLLTDWVVLTASVGADVRATYYLDACSESTPQHSLEGLLDRGQRRIRERDEE